MRENELHASVVEFLRFALPEGALFNHAPGEGKRSPRAQAELKASGYWAGWPDLEILVAGAAYFIELKTARGHLSAQQVGTHAALRRCGFPVATCRSLAEVETALQSWRIPLRARVAA